MRTLASDLRFALRLFAKSPGLTAAALVTLALGTGANAAIFTVVDAVLVRPLPFPRPGELVRITSDRTGEDLRDAGMSVPELFDYRDRAGLFSALSGLFPINANVTGLGAPERTETLLVDPDYFDLLAVKPRLGRFFVAGDYRPGIADVLVVSDGWWRRHGADPEIVGRRVRVDDDVYTIVGVAPPGFRHPGRGIETDVDIWAPTGWIASPFRAPDRRANFLRGALARLRPGVTLPAAKATLARFGAELVRRYPADYPATAAWTPRLVPLQRDLVGETRPVLLVLAAASGLVLLIACANVANLLLARAASRRREIAVRRALGASRGRLLAQLLSESMLLAGGGSALGVLLAVWSVPALLAAAPSALPRAAEIRVDARVLLFATALSVGTGLLFGLAPALSSLAGVPGGALREDDRGAAGGRGHGLRRALVVAEFALALVLLVGATLLVRTLAGLQRVDPGFDPRRVTTATLWLPQPNAVESGRYFTQTARATLSGKILAAAERLPGVESFALASAAPFGPNRPTSPFTVEGRDPARGGTGAAELASVSPGYFAAMALPLREGRTFSIRDAEGAMPVAILSEALARRYFPGEQAVGRRVRVPTRDGPGPWMTVVGIVRDVKTEALDAPARPLLYRPLLQASNMSFTLLLRSAATPSTLGPAIARELSRLDPEIPVYAVRSMDDALSRTVAPRRFTMVLLALFAALAVLLAAVGVSGVIAYGVAERTREIGIRMALGARPRDVQRLVLGQGLALAAAGSLAGLFGAAAATRGLSALLFGVSPRDPATFGGIAALLAAVAIVASWIPARRASRVDPLTAMRTE